MVRNYIEDSRTANLKAVFSKDKTVADLVNYFCSYSGPLYPDQTDVLLSEINQREEARNSGKWSRADLLELAMSLAPLPRRHSEDFRGSLLATQP
jgi:hypothetical protein